MLFKAFKYINQQIIEDLHGLRPWDIMISSEFLI